MEIIKEIKCWFRSFKHIKTVKDAQDMDLKWRFNIYGDNIKKWKCRSLWCDNYHNFYRCEELYDNKKD